MKILLTQLPLRLGCVALESVNVFEVLESVFGRGLKNLEFMCSNSSLVDEWAFYVGAENAGA